MKKIAYILPLLATLFLFTACDDEDYRDPSAIVGDYINEHAELLKSSELGWRFDYYPNEMAYGAFNFLMKFREDGRVEMQTDENFFYLFATEEEKQRPYGVQESDYTIQNSQGPVLTFATYSLLSKLADPELFTNGSGWQGDNEFVLMGHSAGGDTIFLKSVRAQRPCYLVKNTMPWDEYFGKLNSVINSIDNPTVANSYFRDLLIAGQDPAVMTGFDMTTRMGVIYRYQNGKMRADSCQMRFTPEGVQLKRPLRVGDVRITHFAYNGGDEFLVNGEPGSILKVAEGGRPKMSFSVRDKVFLGSYEVEMDGVTVEETDLYFIDTNPVGSDDEWATLYNHLQSYLYMVLIPDNNGNYYVDLYDQITDANGQSNVALARCGFSHQWSFMAEDEITFRGVSSNNMTFFATDSETGDYEQNTPLALTLADNVRKPYTAYLQSIFGASSRDRINCVVVPSPDGQYFYFVNKADGSYLRIMKM